VYFLHVPPVVGKHDIHNSTESYWQLKSVYGIPPLVAGCVGGLHRLSASWTSMGTRSSGARTIIRVRERTTEERLIETELWAGDSCFDPPALRRKGKSDAPTPSIVGAFPSRIGSSIADAQRYVPVRRISVFRVSMAHSRDLSRSRPGRATLLAVRMQEDVGLSILTDGENTPRSYASGSTTHAGGSTRESGCGFRSTGRPNLVPRVSWRSTRSRPFLLRDPRDPARGGPSPDHDQITVPGHSPWSTMCWTSTTRTSGSLDSRSPTAVNADLRDLAAAGATIVPTRATAPGVHDHARAYGAGGDRSRPGGVTATTALHTCFATP